MSLLPLPPKRFQRVDDPKYDPIRHNYWFSLLAERRKKIPLLEQAHSDFKKYPFTQWMVCQKWGVHPREMRDYLRFVRGETMPTKYKDQEVLERAHVLYQKYNAKVSFINYISIAVREMDIANPRHYIERWECDPKFYPLKQKPHNADQKQ